MPVCFATNDDNDLYLDKNGNIAVVSGIDAILFGCKAAVEVLLGEMIYQTDEGMPNFQTIWRGSPNIAQFEAALITQLLNVSGVVEILDLKTTIAANILSYRVEILTNFGSGEINNDVQL